MSHGFGFCILLVSFSLLRASRVLILGCGRIEVGDFEGAVDFIFSEIILKFF